LFLKVVKWTILIIGHIRTFPSNMRPFSTLNRMALGEKRNWKIILKSNPILKLTSPRHQLPHLPAIQRPTATTTSTSADAPTVRHPQPKRAPLWGSPMWDADPETNQYEWAPSKRKIESRLRHPTKPHSSGATQPETLQNQGCFMIIRTI